MKLLVRLSLVLSLGVLATQGQSADPKDARKPGKTYDSKPQKAEHAAAVDFAGTFGLALDSLTTLGARIDAARHDFDPVALASVARELAVAEELSGKKAKVTADELTRQAVEAAKHRNRPDELRAVAKLLGDKDGKGLLVQAERALKENERRKKEKEPRPKGVEGSVVVRNLTPYYVRVYVNYEFRGVVGPYGTGTYYVGDLPYETTSLYAYAPGTSARWNRSVPGPHEDVAWTLYGS